MGDIWFRFGRYILVYVFFFNYNDSVREEYFILVGLLRIGLEIFELLGKGYFFFVFDVKFIE